MDPVQRPCRGRWARRRDVLTASQLFGDQRIVGTDAFEPSLAEPLSAFVDRWDRYGPERTSRLEADFDLGELR